MLRCLFLGVLPPASVVGPRVLSRTVSIAGGSSSDTHTTPAPVSGGCAACGGDAAAPGVHSGGAVIPPHCWCVVLCQPRSRAGADGGWQLQLARGRVGSSDRIGRDRSHCWQRPPSDEMCVGCSQRQATLADTVLPPQRRMLVHVQHKGRALWLMQHRGPGSTQRHMRPPLLHYPRSPHHTRSSD